jgi:hypothetical protein
MSLPCLTRFALCQVTWLEATLQTERAQADADRTTLARQVLKLKTKESHTHAKTL